MKGAMSVRRSCVYKITFLWTRNSQAVVATNQKGQTLIEIEEDCYGGLRKTR